MSLALWAAGCVFNATRAPTGAASIANMRMLGTAVEVFRSAEGQLPETLQEICTNSRACEHLVPEGMVDEWRMPVRYSRNSSDYVLQSAGPDRRFDTADDLVVSTAYRREMVQRLAGCYAISVPWWNEFPGEKLLLRREPKGSDSYVLLPEVYGAAGAWRPISGDSVELTWIHGVAVTRMVLRGSPDGSLHGWWRAGGEYRSSRTRQVTAQRVAC